MTSQDDDMHDDELLTALGRTARQEEEDDRRRLDPRWDAVAGGGLSEEEKQELVAATAPERVEGAKAAFAPLGDEAKRAMVAGALERLAAGGPEESSTPEPLPFPDGASPPPAPSGASLRWARTWRSLAAAIVATAAVVLFFQLSKGPLVLPEYSMEIEGDARPTRGPEATRPAQPVPLAAGNRFSFTFRPSTSAPKEPRVEPFLRVGGQLRPWPVAAQVTDQGTVRIEGVVGEELPLHPEESAVVIWIGYERIPREVLLGMFSGEPDEPAGCVRWTHNEILCRQRIGTAQPR